MDYVIYTTEGFTQSPNGTDIENCQILAFVNGFDGTARECLDEYLCNNDLSGLGWSKEELRIAMIQHR